MDIKKLSKIEFLFTLSKEKEKIPTFCIENISRILQNHDNYKDIKIYFDNFRQTIVIEKNNKLIPLEERHIGEIMSRVSSDFTFLQKATPTMVFEAIKQVAFNNEIDSAADYFSSLVWDGVPRIDNWLSEIYGTPNDMYHKAVGSNFLKGIVKRVMIPGCKFDYVFVLEGAQGTKKSTSLSILGGDWYVETTMSTETKDFFMQFQGNIIVEFSEGETMSRTDTKRMKAIVTTQVDKFRPPFERLIKEFKRRCVFAMTTNDDEYLKDDTGNRRWLPVTLKRDDGADIEKLKEIRDQLFAEAYHRVITLGESVHEFPTEETMEQQALRQEKHPFTEKINDWYVNWLTEEQRINGISTNSVFDEVLHKDGNKNISRYDEMIIGTILRDIGLEKRRIVIDGVRVNRYFRKETKNKSVNITNTNESIKSYEF